MPAVVLSRLNREIEYISEKLAKPVEFKERLEGLLIRYGDLTYKPGTEVSQARDLSSSYRTARIVMQHLRQRFAVLASSQPDLVPETANVLWDAEKTEMRTLAAVLIGNMPEDYADVTIQHLTLWSAPELETIQLQELYNNGTRSLRSADTNRWLRIIHDWLSSSLSTTQRLGLLALTELSKDEDFKNLPALFSTAADIISIPPVPLTNEVRLLISALIDRSPVETAYTLKQHLTASRSPLLVRIVRRLLPSFPEEQQVGLRQMIRTLSRGDEENPSVDAALDKLEIQE